MERPKRRKIPVSEHSTFTERPDGRWEVRFPPLGVRAEGDTKEDARKALIAAIGEATDSSPDALARFKEWSDEFGVEEEIPEDEWRAQQATIEASHAASAGFPALTVDSFQDAIAGAAPLLVDFWAEWCMPCHRLAPTLKQVADQLDGRMRVAKLNVDDHHEVSERLGIKGIPTMILFREGKELHRLVGSGRSREQMLAEIEPHL